MNKGLKKKLKNLKEINKKKYNEYYNVDELERDYGISRQRLEKILRTKEYFESIKNF
jgi:hypothetical protein